MGSGKMAGMRRVVHTFYADITLHNLVGVECGGDEHWQEHCQKQARDNRSAYFCSHLIILLI
ncbi:MAG: hypothetical protein IJK46_05325 [Prevotella sp.]|nr:hypothetical protein [Prevotella sp.]